MKQAFSIIFLFFAVVVCAGNQGIHSIDQKSYLEFKYHGPGSLSYNIVGANRLSFSVYLLTQENFISWVSNTANQPNFIADGSRLDIFQASMTNYRISDSGVYYIVIYNGDDRNMLRVSYDIDMVPVCSAPQENSQVGRETKHQKHSIEGLSIALGSSVLGLLAIIVAVAYYRHRQTESEESNPEDGQPTETSPLTSDNTNLSTVADVSEHSSSQGSPSSQRSANTQYYQSTDKFSENASVREYKADKNDPTNLLDIKRK